MELLLPSLPKNREGESNRTEQNQIHPPTTTTGKKKKKVNSTQSRGAAPTRTPCWVYLPRRTGKCIPSLHTTHRLYQNISMHIPMLNSPLAALGSNCCTCQGQIPLSCVFLLTMAQENESSFTVTFASFFLFHFMTLVFFFLI